MGWLSLILLLTLGAGYRNPDFVYLLLMLLFLVIPFLMMIKYFEYAVSPETRRNVLDKYLEIDDTRIVFHFADERTECVYWSDIGTFKERGEACWLYAGRNHYIYIPRDAFDSPADYRNFCNRASEKINARDV